MKKFLRKFCRTSVFLTLSLLTLSCSQKKYTFSETGTDAQELIFLQAKFSKTGIKDSVRISEFYYPQELNNFFFRHTLENGELCYLIEKYYPKARGRTDGFYIYLPEDDKGQWIENLIDTVEEEKLGSELFELLENEMEVQPPIDFEQLAETITEELEQPETENQEENTDKQVPEVEAVEKRKLDIENRLKFMEFGREIFVPQVKSDSRIMIHKNGNYVVRSFYDDNFRMYRKETWTIQNFENAKIETREDYTFNGDEVKPELRIFTAGTKTIKTKYDKNGKVISAENFEGTGENQILKLKNTWDYDEKGRILKAENIENEYEEDKLLKSESKTEVYKYKSVEDNSKEELPPDYEYYENNILKIKTDYVTKSEYTTTIFFDEQYSVVSYYENNKKTKDVYIVDGITRRVKKYE